MSVASSHLEDARIVVIGAGAVGSVIAYRLAQAGANVTIIEKHFPASGTSGNTAARVNSFAKPPREYHRLSVSSMREHQDLARELGGDWFHATGALHWELQADASRNQGLKDQVRHLRQLGYRVETLSPEEAMRHVEPDLFIDPDLVEEVHFAPAEGYLYPVGLCHNTVSAAVRQYGATLLRDEVIGFDQNQGAIVSVQLASGDTLPVDAVVNAAGPSADRIAALAGVELAMTHQPGMLAVTAPAPMNLNVFARGPEVSMRPEGGWRLLLADRGTFDDLAASGEAKDVSHPIVQQALENATKMAPRLQGVKLEALRHGVRPMPKDGLPIIGFDPEVSGLYHAVMHSGITLSAIVGALVTEDFLDAQPRELELFRPERFSDQPSAAASASAD